MLQIPACLTSTSAEHCSCQIVRAQGRIVLLRVVSWGVSGSHCPDVTLLVRNEGIMQPQQTMRFMHINGFAML